MTLRVKVVSLILIEVEKKKMKDIERKEFMCNLKLRYVFKNK